VSRLQDILVKRYSEHYARVNVGIVPEMDNIDFEAMSMMFGKLIKSVPNGSNILDLGCGTGFLLTWLSMQPNIITFGIDKSPTQVEIAKRILPSLHIYCSDGLQYLKKNPQKFSGIFCLDTLEHVESNDLCLEWLEGVYNALLPGGFFFCRVPNAANLTGTYSRYIDLTHHRIFTSVTIIQLLEAGGFRDCRIIPLQTPDFGSRLRLMVEYLLHRMIFRICGSGKERIFTGNIHALGFKNS
jgi:2-polyprenyl-3-methyl-5-hydroxy-6-metoxy-1,4-benzoquinol methylase